MPSFLYALPDLVIFLILSLFTILVSVIFILIDRFFILKKLRYKDNPTIASISSLIGIIYGVLMGFLCLYLINNQEHAWQAVQNEANASFNIYRNSLWLQNPIKNTIQSDLRIYLDTVINKEWPMMNGFRKVSQEGDLIILKLSDDLNSYPMQTNKDNLIVGTLLSQLNALNDARHSRIAMSYTILAPELWEVILIGTTLIIAINYAFRVNLYLHLFGTLTFAIMAASMLFLLVTLDTPFGGDFSVTPAALRDVLHMMTSIK